MQQHSARSRSAGRHRRPSSTSEFDHSFGFDRGIVSRGSVNHIAPSVQLGSNESIIGQVDSVILTRQTQVLRAETREVQRGLDVCILADLSGSMAGSKASSLAEQIGNFSTDQLKNNDTLQIIGFDHKYEELLRPTYKDKIGDKVESIQRKIARLEGFGGRTALWDTMAVAINTRARFIAKRKSEDKNFEPKAFVLLVLTDGEDCASKIDRVTLGDFMKKPGVPDFHAHLVGLGSGSSFGELDALSREANHILFSHSADDAIEDVFRTHFAKTVNTVRTIVQVGHLTGGGGRQQALLTRELEFGEKAPRGAIARAVAETVQYASQTDPQSSRGPRLVCGPGPGPSGPDPRRSQSAGRTRRQSSTSTSSSSSYSPSSPSSTSFDWDSAIGHQTSRKLGQGMGHQGLGKATVRPSTEAKPSGWAQGLGRPSPRLYHSTTPDASQRGSHFHHGGHGSGVGVGVGVGARGAPSSFMW